MTDKESIPSILSTSPVSVSSPLISNRSPSSSNAKLSLKEFVESIPATVRERQRRTTTSTRRRPDQKTTTTTATDDDPVSSLFRRLDMSPDEISSYAHVSERKNYTRNLVATDDRTFTLLMLCWNPKRSSPIHDHPCHGCWMRVLRGDLNEKRYVMAGDENGNDENESENGNGRLVCTSDATFRAGDETFIEDCLGYHKIGNDGNDLAVSLHLYSPPFEECRVWWDEKNGSKSCLCPARNYFSEYGRLVDESNKE